MYASASDGDGDSEYEETQISHVHEYSYPYIPILFIHTSVDERYHIVCYSIWSEQQCVIFYNIIYLFFSATWKFSSIHFIDNNVSGQSSSNFFLTVFLVCVKPNPEAK